MAQPTGGNSTSGKSSGGSNGSRTNTGGSRSSSKSLAKGKSGSKTKQGSTELLANKVPSHHAHHGMNGEYTTKGKFANMPDGNMAFED